MDVARTVDLALLGWPPDDQDEFLEFDDDGHAWEHFSGSRTFVDMRGSDPQDVLAAAAIDETWLAAHPADWSDDSSDEHFDALQGEVGPGPDALNVGTAAAVLALSAAGCVTVSSCNGQPSHQYDRPIVAFWMQPPRYALIDAAAAASECGLEASANGLVILYAADIRRFPRFARAIHRLLGE